MLPGRLKNSAWDVSADGSTVVRMSGSGSAELGHEAFLWTEAGGMVGLGDLPGGEHAIDVIGISADGSTVVGYGTSDSGQEAFRWTASEGMVMLLRPEGIETSCVANAASADGSVIVGRCRVPGDRPAPEANPLSGMR